MKNNLVGPNKGEQPKRPEMLRNLCILTFLGSGFSTIAYFFIFVSYDDFLLASEKIIEEYPVYGKFLSGGRRFFLAGFFLYATSLFGAIQMWKLTKTGFHLYSSSQILILLLPVFLPVSIPVSILSVLITFIFILGYALNLKFMK
jgi:hypothetical protein